MRILLRTISGDLTRITLWRNKKEKACDSMLFLFPLERRNRMLFFAERKASKELQAFGLAVSAGRKCIPSAPDTCLHSVNSCNPRRNTPNGQRVQSGSLTPAGAGFQWQMLSARRMLACRAKREQTTVGSRVYVFPSSTMRVRDIVSVSLLVLFSSVRKAHIFLLWQRRNVFFSLRKEKNEKKPRTFRSIVCASR